MLRTGLALLTACSFALFHAPSAALDADDCESAAASLKSSAADLEDAADDLDGATRREMEYAESKVRSKASAVMSDADRVRSACAPSPRFGLPPQQVYDLILVHLGIRFPNDAERRARLPKVKDALMQLAKTHSRIGPSDARMTFAVAELVYLGADE